MNLKAIFPCVFTVGNLISGFLAVAMALHGNLNISAGLILLGAILDYLDGVMARALGSDTRFGRQLDSLADFVSFGIAPLVVFYPLLVGRFGFWALVISVIYLVAGAYRLIRFNLDDQVHRRAWYIGLPITSCGICLAGYILFIQYRHSRLVFPGLAALMILILAALMISTLKYPKFRLFRGNHPLWLKFLLSFLFAFALIAKPQIAVIAMIMIYIGLFTAVELTKSIRLQIADRRGQ